VNGNVLDKSVEFTFTTPTISLTSTWPYASQKSLPRDLPIFLSFDQKINPKEMLKSVKVTAGAGKAINLKLINQQEAEGVLDRFKELQSSLRSQISSAIEGQWLIVQPTETLPLATDATILVEKGAVRDLYYISPSCPFSYFFFFVH